MASALTDGPSEGCCAPGLVLGDCNLHSERGAFWMRTEIQCRLEEAQVEMTGVGRKDEGKEESGVAPCVLEEQGDPLSTHQQGIPILPQPQCVAQAAVPVSGWRSTHHTQLGFPGAARYQVARLWVSGEAGVAGNGIVDTTDPVALRGLDAAEEQRATLTIQRQMEKSGGVQMWVSGGSASPPTPRGQWQCGEGQKMANIFCQN